MMDYIFFSEKLNNYLNKNISKIYYELLKKIIEDPKRYTGVFRITNVKDKIIQNISQSREIKFGYFMEDIISEYIKLMGYKSIFKKIKYNNQEYEFDQLFEDENNIYMIEQKIRDDHDSTKKRGQVNNFIEKYNLLCALKNKNIIGIMWFIDDNFIKNRSFYTSTIKDNPNLKIFYGKELFNDFFYKPEIWDEIIYYLQKNKSERSKITFIVPDLDNSQEFYDALKQLYENDNILFKKLISNHPIYVNLRKEIFPTETNINKLLIEKFKIK